MTRDRSLDDFVGGESGERDGSDDADAGAEARTETEANAGTKADAGAKAAEADAAVGTYRWAPDGVACAACGETVERLWLDDGEQVCEACKEW